MKLLIFLKPNVGLISSKIAGGVERTESSKRPNGEVSRDF